MLMKFFNSNRIFFYIQGLVKYIALPGFEKLRPFLYRPFFKYLGQNITIQEGCTFKYPDQIVIEDFAKIGQDCFIVGLGGLQIGKYLLMGAGTKIVTTMHEYKNIEVPMYRQGLITKPIRIEDDVWLGFNVMVLPGTKIGKGSIIGTSAVVTGKDIPEFSIVAGIPAKVIKSRKE